MVVKDKKMEHQILKERGIQMWHVYLHIHMIVNIYFIIFMSLLQRP